MRLEKGVLGIRNPKTIEKCSAEIWTAKSNSKGIPKYFFLKTMYWKFILKKIPQKHINPHQIANN